MKTLIIGSLVGSVGMKVVAFLASSFFVSATTVLHVIQK